MGQDTLPAAKIQDMMCNSTVIISSHIYFVRFCIYCSNNANVGSIVLLHVFVL